MPFFRSAEQVRKLAELALCMSRVIERQKGKIRIVAHYDADGISAASLITQTLTYMRKDYDLLFVRQLDDDAIHELSKKRTDLWMFIDVGSGQLIQLGKQIHSSIVVIDHHQFPEAYNGNIHHFNPYRIGLDGSRDISSAGMAYILGRTLTRRLRPFIELALVGAAGDMQKRDGRFHGINKLLLEDAEMQGRVMIGKGLKLYGRYTKPLHKALESCDPPILGISGNESASIQFLSQLGILPKTRDGKWRTLGDLSKKEERILATALVIEGITSGVDGKELVGDVYRLSNNYELHEFVTILNACGRTGSVEDGIKLCLGRPVNVDPILNEYRRQISSAIAWMNEQKQFFRRTRKATYLFAENNIADPFIGTVLTIAMRSLIKTNVAVGFSHASNGIKISARAKTYVKELNLGRTLSQAAEAVKGSGGGHILAGGAKIPFGSEERFIASLEESLPKEQG